jgi:hypothetical protein
MLEYNISSGKPTKQMDSFRDVVLTFITDLTTTFPEYAILWNKWKTANDTDYGKLHEYMITVLPERMFDILTQNEAIFAPDSEINTVFLPNVEFKLLFNTAGITENTKQAIWKYLQLIMIPLISSIKNKAQFGETAGLFPGIDETFLQDKLKESIEKMTEFFDNMKADNTGGGEGDNTGGSATPNTPFSDSENPVPDPEKLFDHLQSIFGGKIGSLAKEFAEEFGNDMKEIFNEDDLKDAKTVKDILPKLLKDPKKLMSLVKNIQDKVNHKMETGEFTREDLMRETDEMMAKMREMGGVDNFADMLKGMADKMGLGGKNMRIDKNALKKMESDMKMREKMRSKLDSRRAAAASTSNIVKNEKTGELEFVLATGEKQEKTYLEQKAEIDSLMSELKLDSTTPKKGGGGNKKGGAKRK